MEDGDWEVDEQLHDRPLASLHEASRDSEELGRRDGERSRQTNQPSLALWLIGKESRTLP